MRRSSPVAAVAAPRPVRSPAVAWRDIVKPVRIYSLEAPAFAHAHLVYAARRRAPDGGREDLLTLGAFDGVAPSLRLRMYRRTGEAPSGTPFFAALVHEAAQLGLGVGLAIGRSTSPDLMPTRFGRFEHADLTLKRTAAPDLACGGFRLVHEGPALTITGIACGTRKSPLTREQTGCLIDRLDVASAREDRALIDFFAASELNRNAACAGMRLGPDGRHAAWLNDNTSGGPAPIADKPITSRKRLRRR